MTSNVLKAVHKVASSEDEVIKQLANIVESISSKAIEERGKFYVGISGGSMGRQICTGFPSITTDWRKWMIFFCDERLVPLTDNNSTFKSYQPLIEVTPLKAEQFVVIEPSLSVEAAAKDYERKIRGCFEGASLPRFDLLLLGMGPDGHTASLFPGHPLLEVKDAWVSPISDSPKPPPCRVTLTLPVINNSRNCIFVVCGEGKAETVKRILVDGEPLPSSLVRPVDGELMWLLDEAAASQL